MRHICEQTKLKEIFELFDPDGDGSITVDEFYQGLQALHLNPTKAEVDSLMVMFDHDGDGILTYQVRFNPILIRFNPI